MSIDATRVGEVNGADGGSAGPFNSVTICSPEAPMSLRGAMRCREERTTSVSSIGTMDGESKYDSRYLAMARDPHHVRHYLLFRIVSR